jgi:hypothetical protein
MEVLRKGKAQYRLPPCTRCVIVKILCNFLESKLLNEEFNCTGPFPSVSIRCYNLLNSDTIRLLGKDLQ